MQLNSHLKSETSKDVNLVKHQGVVRPRRFAVCKHSSMLPPQRWVERRPPATPPATLESHQLGLEMVAKHIAHHSMIHPEGKWLPDVEASLRDFEEHGNLGQLCSHVSANSWRSQQLSDSKLTGSVVASTSSRNCHHLHPQQPPPASSQSTFLPEPSCQTLHGASESPKMTSTWRGSEHPKMHWWSVGWYPWKPAQRPKTTNWTNWIHWKLEAHSSPRPNVWQLDICHFSIQSPKCSSDIWHLQHNCCKRHLWMWTENRAVLVLWVWPTEHIPSPFRDNHLDSRRSNLELQCQCHSCCCTDSSSQNDPCSKDRHRHGISWHSEVSSSRHKGQRSLQKDTKPGQQTRKTTNDVKFGGAWEPSYQPAIDRSHNTICIICLWVI